MTLKEMKAETMSLIESKGLTLADVARHLGYSYNAVWAMFTDGKWVQIDTLNAILGMVGKELRIVDKDD